MQAEKTVKLTDDVYEQIRQRAEADGISVDEAVDEAVRIGLSEGRWQRLLKRGQQYGRAAMGNVSEEEAEQLVVKAVHDLRAEQRNGR
jgi:predicted CopG family antitoxin